MLTSRVVVVALLAAAACAAASPTQQRYMWMPDGEGHLHLVDLLEEDTVAPFFDGSTDVTLNLYTRNNPTSAQIIKINSVPSNFNANNPTRFIIHGWNSAAKYMDHFRSAYISSGKNVNIILVDWSKLASASYASAKTSALNVGKYIAQVVENLVSLKGLNRNTLYIIGHSLGAHASGVAGYNLGANLASVVGLDPAAPSFGSESLANRLDATDAKFVQVIHTNGGLLGWADAMGDADFFPNGGKSQAGCGLDLAGSCSHGRSHEYYAESINSSKFVGRRCSTYALFTAGSCSSNPSAVLGESCSTSASGSYFLTTNSASPFAKG